MSFSEALAAVMVFERGYVAPPHETYMGIDRDQNGWWSGWVVIDSCKRMGEPFDQRVVLKDMVVDFYLNEFWRKPGCDKVDKLSPLVASELFEAGVNCGQANGVRFLQRALNVLNVEASLYPDIEVDGVLGGAETMPALAACLKNPVAEGLLWRAQNGEQYIYYKSLKKHECNRGWFGRICQGAR